LTALSIIITWRDRLELGRALPSLQAAAQRTNGEVIIVDFAGRREVLAPQLQQAGPAVRVIRVPDQPYFNKSAAQNIGVHRASGDVFFFCDCDIIVNPDEITQLVTSVAEKPGFFGTLRGVREEEVNSRRAGHVVRFGYELNLRTADGRSLRIVDSEEDARDGTRDAPGLLIVRRSDFLAINGYNSRLLGWGWEDQDMISRLTLGAGLERMFHGTALHLSHDDDARMQHYPQDDRWESRDKMFRRCLANYDRADFQGTYRRDAAELPNHELSRDQLA
jgi:glycosyltransferase involved in cell wall biosynthesis